MKQIENHGKMDSIEETALLLFSRLDEQGKKEFLELLKERFPYAVEE